MVVVIVFVPTCKATGAEVLPLASVVPFTVIVAFTSLVTGVTVTEAVVLLTVAV